MAIFSIKSATKSGTFTSLLTIFLTIEIRSVGKLELRVTSIFKSSHIPKLTTFANTSRAVYIKYFFFYSLKSFGVI